MAYSEEIKQRVIELSPGRSAGEILRVLNREFKDDDLPDERTIRRWRKTSTSHSVTNKEHQEQLADIVDMLLDDIPDSIVYENDDVAEELSKDDIVGILDYNSESVCSKYSTWFFYSSFCIHIANDFPKEYRARNYWGLLNEQPSQLIDILKMIKARKTFNGTCPICKDWC